MTGLRRVLLVSTLVATLALAACSTSTPGQPGSSNPAVAGTVACVYTPSGATAGTTSVTPPPAVAVPATGTVTVTLHMDAGDVTMTLDRAGAPCAVNSLVSLASQQYFDNTSCHRLVPDFVLQCGDPTGTGRGGPGYTFKDELSGSETYPYATVAMANAGPNTNGSQFFIVIGHTVQLPPKYDVLGAADAASMTVVESIAAQGVDPTDPAGIRPAEGAHIITATVS